MQKHHAVYFLENEWKNISKSTKNNFLTSFSIFGNERADDMYYQNFSLHIVPLQVWLEF